MPQDRPDLNQSRDEDEELVASAKRGEKRAFEALVRLHGEQVLAWSNRHVRMWQLNIDGRDLAQKAWTTAYRKLHQFEGRSSFTTWMHKVTSSLASNAHRSQSRQPVEVRFDLDARLPDTEIETTQSVVERLAVEAELAKLDEAERLAVWLKDAEELTWPEVARQMTIALGHHSEWDCRVARNRALNKLRDGFAQ